MSEINTDQTTGIQAASLKNYLHSLMIFLRFCLTKWILILIFGLGGASIGLIIALLNKAEYKAHLSFALIDSSGGGSSLVALASSFGLGNFGANDDAFSGDNLLEILKSRHAIEQTLLTPVQYNGHQRNMLDIYLTFTDKKEKWKASKNAELRNLSFPVNQKRETFTRMQDSVLYTIYNEIKTSGSLSIVRIDKKLGIVNADFTSEDEQFSKLFIENLMDQTYKYFKDTRTSQTRKNIEMMEAKADSIRRLYESALYRSTTYSQINLNAAIPVAAAPKLKQENNAALYGTVYTEVLKNLESLKLDLARQTPMVQVIDVPRYPLEKHKFGKTKGVLIGGFMGGFLILGFLFVLFRLKNPTSKEKNNKFFKSSYN